MPLFDLVCNNCNTEKKDVLKKSDTIACCAKCGGFMSNKVSKANFELRGEGWAKDGYK